MTQDYMPTDDAITVRLLRRDGSEIGSGKSVEEIVERYRADLRDADLSGVDLRDTDLSDADLRGANLRGATISGTNFRDADLRDANLMGACLRDTDLTGADLMGAYLKGAKTDLQEQDETLSAVAERRKERES